MININNLIFVHIVNIFVLFFYYYFLLYKVSKSDIQGFSSYIICISYYYYYICKSILFTTFFSVDNCFIENILNFFVDIIYKDTKA